MKDVVTISSEEYYYECGDGCCSEWGVDVIIELNGKVILDKRTYGFDVDSVEMVLEELGYEVKIKY